MDLHRRNLLKLTAGAAAAAAILPGAAAGMDSQLNDFAALGEDWQAVRRQFVLSDDFIHMSAMLLASHPAPVREAIERHRVGLDNNTVAYVEQNDGRLQEQGRSAAGDYLGLHHSQIALTDSTTMGVGLVYGGLLLRPGDEFLTTNQDYYVTREATRLAADRSGASVRAIDLFDDVSAASEAGLVETVINAIRPETRVLALTWVHSSTGLKLPIAAIGARLTELNADRDVQRQVLFCVDGVHAFGIEVFTFAELGADFLMAGCHKWLFGPRGTGIVAASRRGLDSIDAIIPSFVSDRSFGAWIQNRAPQGAIDADTLTPGGFKAFEHLWSLPEAFDFHARIGRRRVMERTHALASQLKAGLAEMPGLVLRTPVASALSAGIVSFDVQGADPRAVVRQLRQRGIVASVAPYASQHVRLTPSIRNTEAEIETVIEQVRSLAG